MTYIYKTGRIELQKQFKRYAKYIHGRVLDVGVGELARYKHLCKFDEYIGMDIEARKGVVAGRVEKIPFPDNSFDSIVCTQVLGDVYDLNTAFGEMHRVLRVGGIMLITESLFDPLHDEPNDYWRFTKHSLKRLAIDAGFNIEVLESRGGYWSVMAQLNARYWIERLNANNKWFSRILSIILKICGSWARLLDRLDKSRANRLFTHGYILICSK